MRTGNAILLALLVVLVVLYGAKGLGYFVLGVVGVALAIVLAVAFGFWFLRRRARKVLTAWDRHMGDTFQTPPSGRSAAGKTVIDIEPTDVRDASPGRKGPGQRP